jgi:hypothetical protein
MSMMKFHTTCVQSTYQKITEMTDAAKEITRQTFLKYVNKDELKEIEKSLGYSIGNQKGLKMKDDWAVSYHKSTYNKKKCVYFRWSAIEHIFV